MRDLTRDAQTGAKAYLVPSSMSAGNTVSDDPGLSMTAKGSPGVNNYAEVAKDVLPLAQFTNPDQIPVSHPGMRDRVMAPHAPDGNGPAWQDAHDIADASEWKEAG